MSASPARHTEWASTPSLTGVLEPPFRPEQISAENAGLILRDIDLLSGVVEIDPNPEEQNPLAQS